MSAVMGKEAVLPSVGSPDESGADIDRTEKTPCPLPVRIAGMIWIVVGCLIVLNGLMVLTVLFAFSRNEPVVGGAIVQLALQVLIGALLCLAGVRCLRGAAHNSLVGGIGSILLSQLVLGLAVWLVSLRVMFTAEVYAPVGVMLLVAGVLALAGGNRYRRWRLSRANPPRRPAGTG